MERMKNKNTKELNAFFFDTLNKASSLSLATWNVQLFRRGSDFSKEMSIELLLIIPNMTYVIFFKKLTYYAYTVYNFEYKICSMGHTLILKACKPPK